MSGGGGKNRQISRCREDIIIPELEDAPAPKNNFWSNRDKAILIHYYGRKETRAIGKYLNRTTTQITAQAQKLGISFESTEEERNTLIAKLRLDDP